MRAGDEDRDGTPEDDRRDESELAATLELVRRSRDGDERALHELFARYADRVHRIVRVRMGQHLRGRGDSLDIVQETLLDAYLALERFEGRRSSDLLHWLAAIAENRIRGARDRAFAAKRDARRERALESLRAAQRSGALRFDPASSGILPDEAAAREEERERLDAAVAELSADHREVVVLRDYEQLPWERVAETMGRSVGAVTMLHARARLELGKRLAAPAGGGPAARST